MILICPKNLMAHFSRNNFYSQNHAEPSLFVVNYFGFDFFNVTIEGMMVKSSCLYVEWREYFLLSLSGMNSVVE